MRSLLSLRIVIVCLLLSASLPVSAQIPDEFTNLQVLPKQSSKRELMGTMRGFATGLGVRCTHCHVGEDKPGFEGFDFASDAKKPKQTARAMLRMVQQINGTLLPKAGVPETARVECSTCHRGIQRPLRLVDVMLDEVSTSDVDSAVTRYRELRAKHYGSAAYDFSPASLTEVSETLAATDLDAALAMIRLNLEFDPDVAYSRLVEAQILLFKGETEAGFAAIQKAIDLEPDNPLYTKQLERARQQFGSDE